MAKLIDKETLKKAVLKATQDGFRMTNIAESIGTSRQNLHNFTKKGYLSQDLEFELTKFLSERGYLSDERPRAVDIIVSKLRNLADTLESPEFSDEYKAREYASVIGGLSKSVDAHIEVLKKKEPRIE